MFLNATYRLQFNKNFRFKDALLIIAYLEQLGITDIYSSPITRAEMGSLHGYNVIDHQRLNPEIGAMKEFEKLSHLCRRHGLGFILDIVPNHMASSSQNLWWQDVLKNGKNSPFAAYFDINWKNTQKLSYRRFFDINELVCLKVENKTVFNAVHRFIFDLIKNRRITALRIDHLDGLYDPQQYLQRLNQSISRLTPDYLPIWVEKILAHQETLPTQWPIAGTTGYEFLNSVNSLFIDPNGYQQLVTIYHQFTNNGLDWPEVKFQNKQSIIQSLFSEETDHLTDLLLGLIQKKPQQQYARIEQIRQAIITLTASLPVYRTYINKQETRPEDARVISSTLKIAKNRLGKENSHHFKLIKKIILTQRDKAAIDWIMRWQQYTDPIMAKGYEDTTCYLFNPLISISEVGSDPSMIADFADLNQFHQRMKKRRRYPYALNTSSTHDTKRSEDVRARINVLSELADEWRLQLQAFHRHAQKLIVKKQNKSVPDRNMEVFLYQSLLGAWPMSIDRVKDFMIKAVREAKQHSSWSQPDSVYETALANFIEKLLKPGANNAFLTAFLPFQSKIAFYGALNSLSQLVITLTSPGVPDIYQGNELWNFSLVDPDNRRPVDYRHRIILLNKLMHQQNNGHELINLLCRTWPDGQIKLFILYKTLQFRKQFIQLFHRGQYIPLESQGLRKNCVIPFARKNRRNWVVTAVPRMTTRLVKPNVFPLGKKIWHSTAIVLPTNAPNHWKNLFTNEIISVSSTGAQKILPVSEALSQFPVALLHGSFEYEE